MFVVTGGTAGFGTWYRDSTEVLIEGSKGWTRIDGSLPSARAGLRMVRNKASSDYKFGNWLIATGKLKILSFKNVKLTFSLQGGEYGSTYGSGIYSDQILRFSPNDFKWYEIGKMKEARAYHGMSVVEKLDACV